MLDTFPYNSHTTACDAISVGLPILTIAGKSFASRVSGSLLTCIGVQDLIVDSHASYESMAILLAHDSHRYGKIRQRVREGIGRLPSNIEYARNLESLYKTWTYR
jgi:predicted O-linked N-acetylglucosamine transferase (SPINDLY family)